MENRNQDSRSAYLPLQRWWIYQRERFPIVKHGLLIAVFCGAAVSYAGQLTDGGIAIAAFPVALITVFGIFLQMRIADEFKDAAEDARYRPYRPVPRGLVSLAELARIGLGVGVIQLGLALWLSPWLLPWLLLLWGYFGLMCREFFLRPWLKAHPLIYTLSHMVIVPLIGWYATACHWVPTAASFGEMLGQLWPFLFTCWGNGLVIELGRKIRAPEDEEVGVETYTALWGVQAAIAAWISAIGFTLVMALVALDRTAAIAPGVLLLGGLAGLAGFMAWKFWTQPSQRHAGQVDALTGLWTLGVYLSLGLGSWLS
jgi:4-hydroxybenzoate polyprenyltransferase